MQNTTTIRSLHTSFNLPLHPAQIRQWRGAFIEMAGWEDDLFTNHITADTYHYRYPLVQYRISSGQAAITALNAGVEAFQRVLAATDWRVNWQGSRHDLLIEQLRLDEHPLEMLPEPRTYSLHKYLPFNQDNYRRWQDARGMIQRIALLEEMLVGHILCFATGMDYQLPERLEVSLQNIHNTRCLEHKVPMMAFDLEFSANISLPFGIGLGKSVSHGYGQCRPLRLRRPRIKTAGEQQEKDPVLLDPNPASAGAGS